MDFVKTEKIWLKTHPELDERWVQDRIAEDPSILGLGDVVLKDRERIHPTAGRLDLLFQDIESTQRFEVEIQLGKTDESHIIRTIEYWDIERKRYPQYEHTAVLVAEDITSRFLNVIGLFNNSVPLTAIQLNAVRIRNEVALIFTKVRDVIPLGLVDEDEEVSERADRAYWESRGSKGTVEMADQLVDILQTVDPSVALNYNRYYIGITQNGRSNNFVDFRPRKNTLELELRLPPSEELNQEVDKAGLDRLAYSTRYGKFRLRLARGDVRKHEELLRKLLTLSHAGDSTT